MSGGQGERHFQPNKRKCRLAIIGGSGRMFATDKIDYVVLVSDVPAEALHGLLQSCSTNLAAYTHAEYEDGGLNNSGVSGSTNSHPQRQPVALPASLRKALHRTAQAPALHDHQCNFCGIRAAQCHSIATCARRTNCPARPCW